MSSIAAGVIVPIPSLLVESSKKREALSCWRIPPVPAKRTDPAVGANQVGVVVPPEMRA